MYICQYICDAARQLGSATSALYKDYIHLENYNMVSAILHAWKQCLFNKQCSKYFIYYCW